MTPLTTILTPTGMLGYGYPVQDFWDALERGVDAIVVDAGSTDPGPYMLGLDATLVTETSYAGDLRPLLQAVHQRGIPLFISSAGGAGTNKQVDEMVALVQRLAEEEEFTPRIAVIYADVPADIVTERLAQSRVKPNVRGELPAREDVQGAAAIVAQMGAQPFTAVIEGDEPFDVVIAGRAYDPAPHAAWSMSRGVPAGLAWHSGKILECGGACCEPKGSGVLAILSEDAFELVPMSPGSAATPLSVAAHTLYEKSRPDLLPGPDGILDVRECTYTPVDERTVRVTGSRHIESEQPTVKLEGASVVGHRCTFIGGIRDPILIAQLDSFLERLKGMLGNVHPELGEGSARLIFHVYGRDAVMRELEPVTASPHEVGVLGEVTATTPEKAKAIASLARVAVLHLPYDGQIATAGNFALPLNPMENPIGPVCAFSVYHVMDSAGLDLFPIRHIAAVTA